MGKKIDMTGWYMPDHGVPDSLITVIEEDKEYNIIHNIISGKIYWKCNCACGTIFSSTGSAIRSGKVKSCGCKRIESNKKKLHDLTGQVFNRLTVIKRDESAINNTKWICQCICGNIVSVLAADLISGHTQSCGCFRRDKISQLYTKDVCGQKFGKLTVIKYLYNKGRSRIYLCRCDCGNLCEVDVSALRSGNTQSCGCLVSKGEFKIRQILQKANIPFETQYKYLDLVSKNNVPLKFDFFIDNTFLLEFDGKQHYIENGLFKESLEERQERDKLKNNYAKSHNIPLKRIPYWDYDKITLENIMDDTYLIN